ncbi:MAG: hypothetical protein D6725_01230 [Planctomycetota bacterium]|nr:MAG: hypothetical protein D6725_01230 [Planctomycetota bacterium]
MGLSGRASGSWLELSSLEAGIAGRIGIVREGAVPVVRRRVPMGNAGAGPGRTVAACFHGMREPGPMRLDGSRAVSDSPGGCGSDERSAVGEAVVVVDTGFGALGEATRLRGRGRTRR